MSLQTALALQPSLRQRFLSAAGWSLVASVANQGITLVLMILVARRLGKHAYGELVLIQSTIASMSVLAGFGVGSTVARYVAALRAADQARLNRILGVGRAAILLVASVVCSALYGLSHQFAGRLLHAPDLESAMLPAALAIFFISSDGYHKSVLVGLQAMKQVGVSTLVGALAAAPVMLIAASIWGLAGASWALAITACTQAAVSWLYMRSSMKQSNLCPTVRGAATEIRLLWDFALPALLAGLLVSPAHLICQSILAATPNGHGEVALLGVAMQWFAAITFLPQVAGRALTPLLTEYTAKRDHASSKQLLNLSIRANLLVSIPIAIGVAILSPWLLKIYGPEFGQGYPVLILCAFAAVFAGVAQSIGTLISAHAQLWLGMLMNLGWAASFVALTFAFQRFGATGLAGALLFAYLLHTLWTSRWASTQLRAAN